MMNGEAPLVKRACPDLVIGGDEEFATALARAVLYFHGLIEVEVRPTPCRQQRLADAASKCTGKPLLITDSGSDPIIEVLDGTDAHRNHLKLGGRCVACCRVAVQQVVRLL